MLFVKRWMVEITSKPFEFFIGSCIFFVPIFGASVHSVVSTVLALLFITSLFYVRRWGECWEVLSKCERWVLMGFIFYVLSGFLSYYNAADDYEYVKQMGRYIRFALIVPVYLLLVKYNIRVYRYFIAGIFISGPVFLLTAINSIENMPGVFGVHAIGASGQLYQIIFGNIAALNALIMAVHLLDVHITRISRFAILLSMFCALYASLLSVARSGWIALVICAIVLVIDQARKKRFKFKAVTVSLILLTAVFVTFPEKNVIKDRITKVVDSVELFVTGEKHKSASGTRLALWHVAVNTWKEHPVIGTGLGDFDEDFLLSQKSGLYPTVPAHSNTHSVYFQSLATTGTIGFVALICALFVLPYRLFQEKKRSGAEFVGLSGMIFILSFAIFGLTESWTLRAPFMSMYLVYFVALMSSAPRPGISEKSGQNSALNQSAIDEKSLPT